MTKLRMPGGRRAALAGIALLALFAAGFWLYRRAEASEGSSYRYAAVERGDLESTVSATGTLSAVTTVQVGTQVSGQVNALYVDFNDRVRKGQLLARIDPTLAEQAVRDAQAGLERAMAERQQAEREYERNQPLYERRVITAKEYNDIEYQLAVARSNVKSAQVSLDRARRNLAYTEIYAPIDGVVVERNVDVGQTVAASLSAPQLFLIANDLARMQILASVDESDIGEIHEGQKARFTVQTHPNRTFEGTVRQVRLQSKTTENVVSYTTVVEVSNADGTLLPGMTATVDFLTGAAADVLQVPNAALRFRPTEEMLTAAGIEAPAGARGNPAQNGGARTAGRGAERGRTAGAGGDSASRGGQDGERGRSGTIWYVNEAGTLATLRVRTGISDGKSTQVEGAGLRPGMQVIVGVLQGDQPAGATNSPFGGGQRPQGGGGGPRGPF